MVPLEFIFRLILRAVHGRFGAAGIRQCTNSSMMVMTFDARRPRPQQVSRLSIQRAGGILADGFVFRYRRAKSRAVQKPEKW